MTEASRQIVYTAYGWQITLKMSVVRVIVQFRRPQSSLEWLSLESSILQTGQLDYIES